MSEASLLERIQGLRSEARERIATARSQPELEQIRLEYLGKKGKVTQILKSLGAIEHSERRLVGPSVNELKDEINIALAERVEFLLDLTPALVPPADVSLPGNKSDTGGLHPITQMMYDLNDAFASLNFEIFEGPEISSELYEFDSLNFPEDHPARESMDTYWLAESIGKRGADRLCIRPHLTGASVRFMRSSSPPFRIVYPGRVYRNESTDARHERAFFQYEALIVDRVVPLTSGKLLVNTILDTVFGRPVQTRMRAGFFPFVEPGFEIDMQCLVCHGKGCRVCKYVGWLEVMPGGVPHPNVLRSGGIDPAKWMGFYINVGLDRLVMMRYGIDDVRLFHGGDLRFLSQFK